MLGSGFHKFIFVKKKGVGDRGDRTIMAVGMCRVFGFFRTLIGVRLGAMEPIQSLVGAICLGCPCKSCLVKKLKL